MKILLAYPTRSSFIARDIKILATKHEVSEHSYYSLAPANLLRGFLAVKSCDLLYLWFASIRALPLVLFARMLGKPVITVVGGYEAANCPEINYGNARNWRQRIPTRWILGLSQLILAVSRASSEAIIKNLKVAPQKVHLLYHGFEDFARDDNSVKTPVILTVGRADSSGWIRKGIREFFLAAEQMPEHSFVYVGGVDIDIPEILGRPMAPNITLVGAVPFETIGDYYGVAKVYLQASHHESFGCSVAEAMLYRCIPVVRDAYALPEVVGNTGVTFSGDSIAAVVQALTTALKMDAGEGERARLRVLNEFSYDKRKSDLLALIEKTRIA